MTELFIHSYNRTFGYFHQLSYLKYMHINTGVLFADIKSQRKHRTVLYCVYCIKALHLFTV